MAKITGSRVAPHAGAWIETRMISTYLLSPEVAPHAGAWIETTSSILPFVVRTSPLTQGRGLKQQRSAFDLRR